MGEDGFKTTLTALSLFALFSFLMISIAVDFGAEYGRTSAEIGDGSLDLVSYESTAQGIEGNASGYRATFESGDVEDVDDATGIFSVLTNMVSMIVLPFKLLGQVLKNLLGVPVIVTNVLLGLLAIGLILNIWRVIRSGS